MTLTALINGIIAVSKILPYLTKAYDLFTDMWINHKIKQIDAKLITHREKRVALLNAIKGAKTNEERKALSIIMHQFNTGQLSDTNSKRSS